MNGRTAHFIMQTAIAYSATDGGVKQKTMIILFPHNPLDEKQADAPFQSEHHLLKTSNVQCSLFDFDTLALGEFKPKPALDSNETVLYRGWMLNPALYKNLVDSVEGTGAKMITTEEQYILSHHLPSWYKSCEDLTPESVFFPKDADIAKESEKLNWEMFL